MTETKSLILHCIAGGCIGLLLGKLFIFVFY